MKKEYVLIDFKQVSFIAKATIENDEVVFGKAEGVQLAFHTGSSQADERYIVTLTRIKDEK